MIKRIVKIRKDRICDCCGKKHVRGDKMTYGECRNPVLTGGNDFGYGSVQTGIEYAKWYLCVDNCGLKEQDYYG